MGVCRRAANRGTYSISGKESVYAYEWIDESCPIDLDRFSAAYRAIEDLKVEWPADLVDFGLSIDARFMNLGAGLVIPTVEIGDDRDDDPYYRARIFPEETAVDLLQDVEIEQVGWSANWPSSYETSEMQTKYLHFRFGSACRWLEIFDWKSPLGRAAPTDPHPGAPEGAGPVRVIRDPR